MRTGQARMKRLLTPPDIVLWAIVITYSVSFEERPMSESLYALALLACPVGMGAMMWMMMRGQHKTAAPDTAAQQAELTALRAQIDQLEAGRRDASPAGSSGENLR
jgi:hypothetical protein